MITVRFACGHAVQVGESVSQAPECSCGERRVRRVAAPAPRFRGFAQGPCATFDDRVQPRAEAFTDRPLRLKKAGD